jgi:hypothetical protein
MLQLITNAVEALAPRPRRQESAADRRAHPRIPSTRLRGARIRIRHRASVSLVDLSSGGALLELPFQAQPDTRFAVELHTPSERVEMPFQLLRCYVADLNGGVSYHAAGAFDNPLDLQAMALRASGSVQRLIVRLEQLCRSGGADGAQLRSRAQFNERLAGVIVSLRRGDSLDLVALRVKAHLTQAYPSLTILPTMSAYRDALTTVECFGLTFCSRNVLSAHDRRYLKANAQLIALLAECQRERCAEDEEEPTTKEQVIFSPSEWLAAQRMNHQPQMAPPSHLSSSAFRFEDSIFNVQG